MVNPTQAVPGGQSGQKGKTMTAYFENKHGGVTKLQDVTRIDKCATFFNITGYEIRYSDGTFSIVDSDEYTLVSIEQ